MTLRLTPETLRAAYDFLCTTEPFNRWNLPDSEDVVFRVVKDRTVFGWYNKIGGRHVIAASSSKISHTDTLMMTIGHELIHVHENNTKSCGRGEHSAAFMKWAAQVSKVHGWDPKAF